MKKYLAVIAVVILAMAIVTGCKTDDTAEADYGSGLFDASRMKMDDLL